MLNVTQYQNAFEFLRQSWEDKKLKNPRFSVRAWAKQLGMASHTPLALMISGKRSISRKHIPALIKSLNLSPKEGLYFETLVGFNQAKSSEEKEMYFDRLKVLEGLQ